MRDCRLCNETKPHLARGLCRACYERMRRRGRLEEFPRIPQKGRAPDPREHGTAKGWRQHYHRGEDACDPCLEAIREKARKEAHRPDVRAYQRWYQRRWKAMKRGKVTGALRCDICGLRLSMHSLTDNCARAS